MKILLLNPNTSTGMTDQMVKAAAPSLAPDTELVGITATRGFPYIAGRAEALIAGSIALEMVAEHKQGADAIIIAAYGDPGLIAIRELFDVPVTGMAEAAMLTACMAGGRFSILTFTPTLLPWYEDAVISIGLFGRCTGVRVPTSGFKSVDSVQEELEEDFVALADQVVREDGADAIILAGAPLAGLAFRIADRVSVPLIDPLSAAIGQAQTLARMKPRAASAGRFARPGPKQTVGLTPALAGWIEHRTMSDAATNMES